MEHVTGNAERPEGCLFEPPGTEPFSEEHLLLHRDDLALVMLNRFPYANGHLLVAPVRHVGCITELQPSELQALTSLVQTATTILKRVLQPDGFNIGLNLGSVAGAGIDDHLHVHIVPRWNDDHNFMTVLAEVRTIPEHIQKTFGTLLPEFQSHYRSQQFTAR